jgi:hypothetical protein
LPERTLSQPWSVKDQEKARRNGGLLDDPMISGRQSADTTLIPVDAWARFCGRGFAAGAVSTGWDEGLNRSLTPENILL